MISIRLLLILVSVSISNVKTIAQSDFFENQKETLSSLLLVGDLDEVESYFKTQDLLFSTGSIANGSEKISEYNRIRNKYMSLIKKIKLITGKSEEEIIASYSHFIPIHLDYEKKLISENSIKAFKRFLFFYNDKNYSEAAKFINICFFFNFEEKSFLLDE